MSSQIGLYYPFINLPHTNWLKMALLYWDKVARIVPDSYRLHDPDDVQMVRDSLDFVRDIPPSYADQRVIEGFRTFIHGYSGPLRARYGIQRRHLWRANSVTRKRAPSDADSRLAYVFDEKLSYRLTPLLIHEGLAEQGEGRDPRWIGMHPDLANVYMTAIAESIATESSYSLLADDQIRQMAVGAHDPENIAALMLNLPTGARRAVTDVEHAMALAAIAIFVPKNLDAVPLKTLITFRTKHQAELREFQTWLHKLVDPFKKVTSIHALRNHFAVMMNKEVQPRIDELRKQLNQLQVDTASSLLSVKIENPALLATAGAALGGPPLAVAGFAVGFYPQVRKASIEATRAVASNPAAYLMYVSESFGRNRGPLATARRRLRQIVLGR